MFYSKAIFIFLNMFFMLQCQQLVPIMRRSDLFTQFPVFTSPEFPRYELFMQENSFDGIEYPVSLITNDELLPYENKLTGRFVTSLSNSPPSIFSTIPPYSYNGLGSSEQYFLQANPEILSQPTLVRRNKNSKIYNLHNAEYNRPYNLQKVEKHVETTLRPISSYSGSFEERIFDKFIDNLPTLASSFISAANGLNPGKETNKTNETMRHLHINERQSVTDNPLISLENSSPIFSSFEKLMALFERKQIVIGDRNIHPKFVKKESDSNIFEKASTEPLIANSQPELATLMKFIQPLLQISLVKNANDIPNGSNEQRQVWTHSDGRPKYNSKEHEVSIRNKQPSVIHNLMSRNFNNLLNVANEHDHNTTANSLKNVLIEILHEVLPLTNKTTHDDGNSLAQILQKNNNFANGLDLGAFFGSGLDDSPSIPNKILKNIRFKTN